MNSSRRHFLKIGSFALGFVALVGSAVRSICRPQKIKSGLERRRGGLYGDLSGLPDQDTTIDGERS